VPFMAARVDTSQASGLSNRMRSLRLTGVRALKE
jgi:hypothetical protein